MAMETRSREENCRNTLMAMATMLRQMKEVMVDTRTKETEEQATVMEATESSIKMVMETTTEEVDPIRTRDPIKVTMVEATEIKSPRMSERDNRLSRQLSLH